MFDMTIFGLFSWMVSVLVVGVCIAGDFTGYWFKMSVMMVVIRCSWWCWFIVSDAAGVVVGVDGVFGVLLVVWML